MTSLAFFEKRLSHTMLLDQDRNSISITIYNCGRYRGCLALIDDVMMSCGGRRATVTFLGRSWGRALSEKR